jgi:PAS domain S-box-containing protein
LKRKAKDLTSRQKQHITERKQMEEEIRSLARFPSENPNPLLRIDKNGILLTTNEASRALLEKWSFGVGQVAPKFWYELVTEALSTGLSKNVDVKIDDRLYCFFVKPNVEAGYVNLYGRDITERKEMQAELERYSKQLESIVEERTHKLAESEGRFRELVDLLPQIVFEIDEKGNLTFLNDIAFASTGYGEDDLRRGLNAFQMFAPEDHDRAKQKIRKLLGGEKVSSDEYTVLRKDGSAFPAIVYAVPVMRENRVVGVRGIVVDITERKRAEEALRVSEDRFRGIAERIVDVIIDMDLEGGITYASPSAEQALGYKPEEMNGTHMERYLPQSEISRIAPNWAAVMQGKSVIGVQGEMLKKDGTRISAEMNASPILKDGRLIGVQGVIRDITERKRIEERLVKSERLAAIGEVAAMVGHDLRNPLQGIAGALHLLRQDSLTANERKETLQLIQNDIEYSDAIVRHLSEYSAEIILELADTTPKSLTREAIQAVKVPPTVTVQDLSQNHPTLKVDTARIKRVLVNLIQNSIEAMPQGGTLTITSRLWNDAVEIVLTDTGSGMPEKVMKSLWKPLQTTKSKGLGLGLSICKHIVDAHGGTISVKSRAGEGTTVTIRLPTKPVGVEVKQK